MNIRSFFNNHFKNLPFIIFIATIISIANYFDSLHTCTIMLASTAFLSLFDILVDILSEIKRVNVEIQITRSIIK